ncbi:MAG TPA: ATP-binding protein [Polyangiales bacterium]|nr:ATP-binding protein [Polyangiales bacterium]
MSMDLRDSISADNPALEQALATARELFAPGIDALAVVDKQLCVREWSLGLEHLSGRSRDTLLGRPLAQAFPERLQQQCLAPFAAALSGRVQTLRGRCFAMPETITGPEDPRFDSFFLPLTAADGGIVGCAALARDRLSDPSKQLSEQLSESEARFRTMADCAPVLLWMAGTDARCNFFNQTWLTFRGRDLAQEFGFGWAEGIHPEEFQMCMDTYMEAFRERREFEMVYRLQRSDGMYRWILDHGTPRFGASGEFLGYIGSCTDITERKTAEDALRKTGDRLAHSNAELERFAHAASHDLQEPLRMVINFTSLLAKKYDAQLDDSGRQYVAFAVDGARRMKALIDGLLALSSIKTIDRSGFRAIDVNDLMSQVLANLQLLLAESGAQVEVAKLPMVRGHTSLLLQTFQNLIHNALKFRRELPRIQIDAEVEGAMAHFRVKDNGIGLDMKYADRVFVVFQRLHARNEYPGSGIGLGLCKQIVEVHEGKIWLDSVPNQGTTVHLTLPLFERKTGV